MANPALIESIVYNLCDNAIRYNKEGGQVFVRIQSSSDSVQLEVEDTGIGISKDEQQRIFERFYRIDKSHSKKVGGTGLGLSIVKHAVQLHGAQIQIDSQEGKGTKMTVIFKAVK